MWKYRAESTAFPRVSTRSQTKTAALRVSPRYFMTQISSRQPGIPLFLFRLSRRERRFRFSS